MTTDPNFQLRLIELFNMVSLGMDNRLLVILG